MGKSAPKQPNSPDPNYLAAMQRKENEQTAQQQAAYGQIGVQTPFASTSYSGDIGSANRTKHIALSKPIEERMQRDNALHAQLHEHATHALEQMPHTSAMPDLPAIEPVSEQAVAARESALFDSGKTGVDKDFKDTQKRLDIQLGQRGISQGSKAYQGAMRGLHKTRLDALASLSAQASTRARQEGQAKFNQDIAWRNQQINESMAKSGEGFKRLNMAFTHMKQASPENYTRYLTGLTGNNAGGARPVDVAGYAMQNARTDAAYQQARDRHQNSMLGGLFSLGKSFL